MRRFDLCVALSLVFLFASCSQSFKVNISGNLKTDISLCFFYENRSDKPVDLTVYFLSIDKLNENNNWEEWVRIESEFKAHCFSCKKQNGISYIRHKPLEANARYRIFAQGTPSSGGTGGSCMREFLIDRDGNPELLPEVRGMTLGKS